MLGALMLGAKERLTSTKLKKINAGGARTYGVRRRESLFASIAN